MEVHFFCLANMMNYTDGCHGGRDKSGRFGGMNHVASRRCVSGGRDKSRSYG